MVTKVLQCLKLKMTSSQNVLKRTGPKRTKEQKNKWDQKEPTLMEQKGR